MTVSAVQFGTMSQPQVKSPETGFSDVLSEVRTAAPQNGANRSAENGHPTSQPDNVEEKAPDTATAELTAGVKELKAAVVRLVSKASGGDSEASGKIIDALLQLLKKMRNESGDDEAMDFVMEILAALLGETQQTESIAVDLTAVEVSVAEVSAEITQIISGGGENAVAVSGMTDVKPVIKQSAEVEEILPSEEIPETKSKDIPVNQTENQTQQQFGNEQPQTPEQPKDYQKLLNDILNEARKELGLTEAKLTEVNPEAKSEEQPIHTGGEVAGFTYALNRKDGTGELNSILGSAEENAAETPKREDGRTVIAENDLAAANVSRPEIRTEAPEIPVSTARTEAAPPEQQLADEILSKAEVLNGGRTEFTMELNPESLGKITVKLVSVQGRVDVNITADNDGTRQLLAARAENIGAALKNNGVELENYQVVSENENAQLTQESYDGSSKNPYGRNDGGQQENDDNQEDFLDILSRL